MVIRERIPWAPPGMGPESMGVGSWSPPRARRTNVASGERAEIGSSPRPCTLLDFHLQNPPPK